ncbi:MAG TPA: hypothetical protein PKD64_13600 [Pirellulaceae bacterium]|nr:hypothetical protein [Pirellulaceae bacterium]HMO93220.1 hypothetical protein [Pirellulaceae bacterium]HMP70051.1 hypothetical protein [Pirellulaceae bacterium]
MISSKRTLKRSIDILSLGLIFVFLAGCQSMSLPKLPSLAFWKKESPVLTARHDDYIQPPAANVSPMKSKQTASTPNGLPSTIPPGNTKRESESPIERYALIDSPQSDALADATAKLQQIERERSSFNPQKNSVAGLGATNQNLVAEAERLVQNADRTQIDVEIDKTPVLDVVSRGEEVNPYDFVRSDPAQLNQFRQTGTGPLAPNFGTTNSGKPDDHGNSRALTPGDAGTSNIAAQNNYPTTPYREFQPASADGPNTLTPRSNLNALTPVANNATTTNQISPLSPLAQTGTTQPNSSTNGATSSGVSSGTVELPANLRNSQVSFAPGSIRKLRENSNESASATMQVNSPLMRQSATTEANATGPPPQQPPSNLESGGSFKFR